MDDPRIPALRQRLAAEGYIAIKADSISPTLAGYEPEVDIFNVDATQI